MEIGPGLRQRTGELEREAQSRAYTGDRLGNYAADQFNSVGHAMSYLQRWCPSDGMSCGACPISGCDNGGMRKQIIGERHGRNDHDLSE